MEERRRGKKRCQKADERQKVNEAFNGSVIRSAFCADESHHFEYPGELWRDEGDLFMVTQGWSELP
jgi:hypothetical protein